jgi:hypothetical protein
MRDEFGVEVIAIPKTHVAAYAARAPGLPFKARLLLACRQRKRVHECHMADNTNPGPQDRARFQWVFFYNSEIGWAWNCMDEAKETGKVLESGAGFSMLGECFDDARAHGYTGGSPQAS